MHDWLIVDDVAAAFAQLILDRAPGSIALSGGETARRSYEAAAATGADWSGTAFWFGDERWVPVGDPDSNEGMARAAWLGRVDTGEVVSLATAASTRQEAADAYDARLRSAGGVDLVHLGLGPDGHTASIFPGSPTMEEDERWVVVSGDDRHPHPRLTFTFPAISAARTVVVTVAGEEKRDAVARVRSGDLTAPAAHVDAAEVVWLLDRAAVG